MLNISKFVCVVFGAAVLLTGCKGKDGDPGPAGANGAVGPSGPSGQNLTGNIFGFVTSVDEYSNATAKNGITVTLDGVTPAATATTNADGRYEFVGVRNGTYNMTFSRAGLATFRRLGIAHVGGDQPTFLGTTTIAANSTTSLGTVTSFIQPNNNVALSIPFTNAGAPAGSNFRFVAYLSASSGTTAANGIPLVLPPATNSPLNVGIPRATLNSLGFASGTTVYLVVYGAPSFLTGYTDPLTGRFVYVGLTAAPSNQVSFVVP